MKININNIIISIKREQNQAIFAELLKYGIKKENIKSIIWNKRSIDSRQKRDIKFLYNLEVTLNKDIDISKFNNINLAKEIKEVKRVPIYEDKHIAVIGAGPAGLFAALRLSEHGYIPHVFERGKEVDKRDEDNLNFINNSILNPNSNVQFGEGGAGTYSDGKLNTRIKSEYIHKVFEEFVEMGADPKILWDYKPHIGTDVLKIVVKNLREKIKSLGGKFYFNHRLESLKIKNQEVVGINVFDENENLIYFDFKKVILAIGHSARDTYRMLNKIGVAMENKPFAVGTRIEHLQSDINKMQYGDEKLAEILGAATYAVTYNNKAENRGVFSFCMCPGGEIVNAASNLNTNLVNGMSYSTRSGKFANSAIVVGIKENEFGDELFSGMKFQEQLEKKAYDMISSYGAIYQNVLDFMKDKKTKHEINSSYKMNKTPEKLNEFFPEFMVANMKKAFEQWGRNKYFISENVNLIGPETRTSAPVKIIRDIKGESINIKNLYPIGEGAGYAGGITSAGVDGLKIVDLSFTKII